MAEGREKLVEEGEEKKIQNGAPLHNGRLLHERDSGIYNYYIFFKGYHFQH